MYIYVYIFIHIYVYVYIRIHVFTFVYTWYMSQNMRIGRHDTPYVEPTWNHNSTTHSIKQPTPQGILNKYTQCKNKLESEHTCTPHA